MLRQFLVCGLALVALANFALADEKKVQLPPAQSNAVLDKMKTLVGTWVVEGKDGKPTDKVASVIKLTAGGSTVHETLFPGEDHEMVSVYTADGADTVMTHYCVLGNQPRMKAAPKVNDNQITWEFVGGTNLDPKKDKHMHGATLTIIDPDHLEVNGTGWENGGPAKEMCGVMKLVRKK